MKMNKNELRNGNLVLHNGNWSYHKFKGPTVMEWSEDDWYALGECTLFIEDISPILITEEWLVKFGFTYNIEEGWGYDFNIGCSISRSDDYVWYYFGNIEPFWTDIVPEIKYIHQLQNLCFVLTGEEMSIKNE